MYSIVQRVPEICGEAGTGEFLPSKRRNRLSQTLEKTLSSSRTKYRRLHRTRLWIRRIVIVQRRLHKITIIICLLRPQATKTLPRVIEP